MQKTILITGASTDFGRIAADTLHQNGHKVYGTSRNPDKYQTEFNLIQMDLTDQGIDRKRCSSCNE